MTYISASDKEQEEFLIELEQLCKRYSISISHEDGHGSFILTQYNELDMNWIKAAYWEDLK